MASLNRSFFLFSFFVSFAVLVPTLHANIAEFDGYWKQRANQAQKAAQEAYQPEPFNVTNQFNSHVNE